jgi:hypothetical protein
VSQRPISVVALADGEPIILLGSRGWAAPPLGVCEEALLTFDGSTWPLLLSDTKGTRFGETIGKQGWCCEMVMGGSRVDPMKAKRGCVSQCV